MRNISFVCSGLVVIALAFKCTNFNNQIAAQQQSDIPVVQIEPKQLLSLKTSDFIESVKYIPLETTSESEFGEISQIECTDSLYLILDIISNQILFFKKNGNFVGKISPENKDIPVPYKNISKFSIDYNRKILSFLDTQKPNVYEFDFAGNFLKIRNKRPVDYIIRETSHLGKYTINYFSFESDGSGAKKSPSITVKENEREIYSYLFYDPSIIHYDDMYDARKYFFKSKENLLFSRPGDYTIYKIDNNGKMNRYVNVFLPEEFKLPDDFLISKEYTKKRRKYLDSNRSKIYLITDVYKVQDMLSCRLVGSKYRGTLLYSLKSRVSINFRNYLSDSSTFFLPIADNMVLGADDDNYISSVPARRMVQAINRNIKIEGYLSSLPDNLKTFYKKGNNQNPILTLIKLKSTIVYDAQH